MVRIKYKIIKKLNTSPSEISRISLLIRSFFQKLKMVFIDILLYGFVMVL